MGSMRTGWTFQRMTMLAVSAMALAACGRVTDGGAGSGGIAHPTGAEQPVIVVEDTGGFVMPQYALTRAPQFALYGDGTAITQGPQIMIYPPPLLPPLFAQRVEEEAFQSLLRAARDAGLFADRTFDDMCGVADVTTTVITIHADDATYVTSVYGLGFEGCQDDPEARAAIMGFVGGLMTFADAPADSIGEPEPYRGEGWLLAVAEYVPQPDLPQEDIAWPLASPTPADAADGCLVVTGEDAETLRPLFEGANQLTPWTVDGMRWSLLVRPLYPGETDPCAAP